MPTPAVEMNPLQFRITGEVSVRVVFVFECGAANVVFVIAFGRR